MSSLRLRPMTRDDLPYGAALSAAAGWNQTLDDWRRVLMLEPDASFVAEFDGVDAGTVTAVVFGPVAWVGLMLVDERFRRRGVGRALMERVLSVLDARGVRSVRLDATPLGRPLYERLGFRFDRGLHRFAGVVRRDVTPALDDSFALRPIGANDLDAVARLDRDAGGVERRGLLESLWRERPVGATAAFDRSSGTLRGFVLSRGGRLGTLVGPCVADDECGPRLLHAACDLLADQVALIDVFDEHAAAREVATVRGLAPARSLARMTRGPETAETFEAIWASSGPEKG